MVIYLLRFYIVMKGFISVISIRSSMKSSILKSAGNEGIISLTFGMLRDTVSDGDAAFSKLILGIELLANVSN